MSEEEDENEEEKELKELFDKIDKIHEELFPVYARLGKSYFYKLTPDKKVVPSSFSEFAEQCNDPEKYRRVGLDQLGPYVVSTVFLMINHGFGGRPLFFETMIESLKGEEGVFQNFQRRYETYEEALAGHQDTVEKVRAGELP